MFLSWWRHWVLVSMCSHLLTYAISQQRWRGLVGPAFAPHWGPTQEKHHFTQQIGTSSAAYGYTHHLHSRPASLVWWAWSTVQGGLRHRYDDDFWTGIMCHFIAAAVAHLECLTTLETHWKTQKQDFLKMWMCRVVWRQHLRENHSRQ